MTNHSALSESFHVLIDLSGFSSLLCRTAVCPLRQGKVDPERSLFSHLTIHLDPSSVFLHDVVRDVESQPLPLIHRLGREEWRKESRDLLGRNPLAGVGNDNDQFTI